jgi:uncharacterized protein
MTLYHETRAWSMDRLGPPDLLEVFGFLDRDPVVNVYLLALTLRDGLAHPRDEFWGVRRDGELVGLLHLGGASGATLPIGDDPEALERVAEQAVARLGFLPGRFQVIGPQRAVDTVVARLGDSGLAPRLARQQVYMSVDRGEIPAFERLAELRRATRDDHELVHESGAMLRAEELDEDPRAADAAGYAKRVEEECRDGYTHLWVDADGLCFRASVSALTPDAAQVSGVYTPPARRNRGLARRALSELSERLFERSRSVCLFVNDFNAPALALYRRIGFRDRAPWASAFYDRRR